MLFDFDVYLQSHTLGSVFFVKGENNFIKALMYYEINSNGVCVVFFRNVIYLC